MTDIVLGLGIILIVVLVVAQGLFMWSFRCKVCGRMFYGVSFVDMLTHRCNRCRRK